MIRPALPRASSAMSGFFFCGIIDEPGRIPVVEHHEAHLAARPEHPLFADPAEVDADHGERVDRVGDEVAIAHRIERVLEPPGEAELGRIAVGIERQRRAGQRTGAEHRNVRGVTSHQHAAHVAAERPAVGQQMVAERHRLGPLEVGVAGQVRIAGGHRRVVEHLLHVDQLAGDHAELSLAPYFGIDPSRCIFVVEDSGGWMEGRWVTLDAARTETPASAPPTTP